MSKGAAIGVVVVLLLLVSAVVAYFLMSGEDGTVGPGQAVIDYVEGDAIRLEKSTNGALMIPEVQVYDQNDSLISTGSGVTITASPTEPGWGGVGGTSFLNDFDVHHPVHTLTAPTNFIEMKFNGVKKIKRVVVVNRSDDRSDELNGVKIRVTKNGTAIKEKAIAWSQGNSYLVEYDPYNDKIITTDTDGAPVKCTSVILKHPPSAGDNLHIAEIEVYDKNGVNVARMATATASSVHHPDWAAANAIDGNLTNTYHSHAAGLNDHDWLKVDFGGEKEIKSIKIYNRVDDIPTRAQIQKSYVIFMNGDKIVHSTPPIPDGDRATYEYKVGKYMNRWKLT